MSRHPAVHTARGISAALLTLAVCAVPAQAAPTPAGVAFAASCLCDTGVQIREEIIAAAFDEGVPPELALAVASIESAFQPDALSPKGARGVMQIMPATARGEFGLEPEELWDVGVNIRYGVRYLAQLHDRYGRWDAALSHYNGGTLRGAPRTAQPHQRTAAYVDAVLDAEQAYRRDSATQAMIVRMDQQPPLADDGELAGGPGAFDRARDMRPAAPPRARLVVRPPQEPERPRVLPWQEAVADDPDLSPSQMLQLRIATLRERVRRSMEQH